MEVGDGLVLAPGTTVDKVVSLFERMFGSARSQKVPCDASIQLPDNSQRLSEKDSKGYRSVVGLCLYAGRERPDLMYTIKELASYMSAPTLTSLARLRKMVGFMKSVGDIGLHLPFPEDVKERLFLVDNTDGYLRASAMPIGVQTSRHVAQHHVGYISSMDVSCIQAAEVNELYHLAHVKVNV